MFPLLRYAVLCGWASLYIYISIIRNCMVFNKSFSWFLKMSHWRVELGRFVCVFGPCDRSWGPSRVGLACSEGPLATFHLCPSRSLSHGGPLLGGNRSYFPLVSWPSDDCFSFCLLSAHNCFLITFSSFVHHIQPSVIWQFLPGLCNFPAHIFHFLHCIGRGWMEGISKEQKQMKLTVAVSHFRKDLKFVSDIEKEMEALVEAVNKVEIKISNSTCF